MTGEARPNTEHHLVSMRGFTAQQIDQVGAAIMEMASTVDPEAAVRQVPPGPRVFTIDEAPPFGERIELVSAGGERLTWDGKRYYWAADGPDLQMRDCWPPEENTGPWFELPDSLSSLRELAASLPEPPPPPKPVRLTQQQIDALPREDPARPTPPWAAYTGAPVERVDLVEESTPWTEGWIRCPYCDTPANGHPGETKCRAWIAARGQDVLTVAPPLTEEDRIALGVYRPDRFGYLR